MPSDFETGATQEGQPVSRDTNPESKFTLGPYEKQVVQKNRSLRSILEGMRNVPEFKNWTDSEIIDEVTGAMRENDTDALSTLYKSLTKHDPAYEGWTPDEVKTEISGVLAPPKRTKIGENAPPAGKTAAPAMPPTGTPTMGLPAPTVAVAESTAVSPDYKPPAPSPGPDLTGARESAKVVTLLEEAKTLSEHPIIKEARVLANTVKQNPTQENIDAFRSFAAENAEALKYHDMVVTQASALDEKEVEAALKAETMRRTKEFAKGKLAEAKKGAPPVTTVPLNVPYGVEFPNDFDAEAFQKSRDYVETVKNLQEAIGYPTKAGAPLGDVVKGVMSALREENLPFFLGTGISVTNAERLRQISTKPEEKRTKDEQLLADSYAAVQQVKQNSELAPILYNVGAGATEMIPYMTEFAALDRVYNLGRRLVQGGIEKVIGRDAVRTMLEKSAQKNLLAMAEKGLVKGVSSIAGGTLQSLADPLRAVDDFERRSIPEIKLGLSNSGELLKREIQGDVQDVLTRALKSVGQSALDFVTERWGVAVEKPTDFIINKALGAWMLRHGIRETTADALIKRLGKQAGWNNILGEFFEEYAQAPFGRLLENEPGKPFLYGKFPYAMTPEEALTTLGVVSIPGLASKAIRLPARIAQARAERGATAIQEEIRNIIPPSEEAPPPAPAPAPVPAPTQPVSPATPAEAAEPEVRVTHAPGEISNFVRQNYQTIVDAVKNYGLYETIDASIASGASNAEVLQAVENAIGVPIEEDVVDAVRLYKDVRKVAEAPAPAPPAETQPKPAVQGEVPQQPTTEVLGPQGYRHGYTVSGEYGKATYDATTDEWTTRHGNGTEGPTFKFYKHADEWVSTPKTEAQKEGTPRAEAKSPYDPTVYPLLYNVGKLKPSWTLDAKTGEVVVTGEYKSLPRELLDLSEKPTKGEVQSAPGMMIVGTRLDELVTKLGSEAPGLAHLLDRDLTGNDLLHLIADEYHSYERAKGIAPAEERYVPHDYSEKEFVQKLLDSLAPYKALLATRGATGVTASPGQWIQVEGVWEMPITVRDTKEAIELYDALVAGGMEIDVHQNPDKSFGFRVWAADAMPPSVVRGEQKIDTRPPMPPPVLGPRKATPIGPALQKFIQEGILPDAKKELRGAKPDDDRVLRRALIAVFTFDGTTTIREAEEIVANPPFEWTDEMVQVLKDAIDLAYARPELIRDYVVIPGERPAPLPKEQAKPVEPEVVPPPAILPSDTGGRIALDVQKEPPGPETPDMPPPPEETSVEPGRPEDPVANLPPEQQKLIENELGDLDKLFGPDDTVIQQMRSAFYEKLEGRYDTTNPRAFYRDNRIRQSIELDYDFAGAGRTINGVRYQALGIPLEWTTAQTIALKGKVVRTMDELAMLGQIFRDPRFETARYFVTDEKGVVVFAEGVSSSMPGVSALIPSGENLARYFATLIVTAKESGGKTLWILHNHPSRYAEPSGADVDATKKVAKIAGEMGLEFGGHVVIDDNTFGFIEKQKNGKWKVSTAKLPKPRPGEDPTRKAAVPSPLIGAMLTPSTILEFGQKLIHSKSHVALIAVENTGDNNAVVTAVADMPIEYLSPAYFEQAKEYIEKFSRQAGNDYVIAAGVPDSVVFKTSPQFIIGGYLQDVMGENIGLSLHPMAQAYRMVTEANPSLIVRMGKQVPEFDTVRVEEKTPKLPTADEVVYQKAKPSFQAIHKAMLSGNLTKEQFSTTVISRYGERVRAYVERYLGEFESQESFRGGLAAAGATGKLGALGRPSIVIVNAKNLPKPGNNVRLGQYQIDEQQRLGVNLALDRISTPGDAFLLADGAGVGKTRQELVVAQEQQKRTGKPSLIVTQNQQIINTVYASDAKALGIELSTVLPKTTAPPSGNVEVITYDGLKAKKGGMREYGVVIFDEAHNLKNVESDRSFASSQIKAQSRVFATATPMDNAHNAAYFMSLITGLPEETVQNQLGYTIQYVPDKIDPTKLRPIARTLEGKTWGEVYQNIRDMRDEAIARGAMIRREFPFYGRISSHTISLDIAAEIEQEQIRGYWQDKMDAAGAPSARMNYAGQRTGELSRWVESKKIGAVYEMMKKDLAEGKSVIVVAEGVEESVNKALSFRAGQEVTTPGFLTGFQKKLDEEGIPYAKIFGGGVKSAEVDKFQSGKVRVAIMTPKSGGAGISLDDVKGNAPRTMYIATVNFGGDVFDQLIYRASRRNTATPVDLKLIHANGSISDTRRARIVARKFGILRNIQAGEDPDIAALRLSGDTGAGSGPVRLEQRRPIWGTNIPPTAQGPATLTNQPDFGSLGKAIVSAWKGEKYILVDGVSGFIAKPAYDVLLTGRKALNYLGLPQYIGNKIPELRGAFVAMKDAFHIGNERFADVKDILNYVRDTIRLNPQEKQNVSLWLWRGNDEDVRRYFFSYELQNGIPSLNLPALSAREADAYEKLVRAQGLATKISMDAMKYFLMNYPLEDEELTTRQWGVYDVQGARFLIPPAPGSLEEQLLSGLAPADVQGFFAALNEIRTQGRIATPALMGLWDTVKEQFKEPIVDETVAKQVQRLGGYLSQQRHGDYYVGWNDRVTGVFNWQQHELESEAVADAKRRAASGTAVNITTGLMTEPGFLSKFAARDMSLGELLTVVDKLGLTSDPAVMKLVNEWKKRGFAAHTIKRRNVLGYERTYDNAVRSIYDYGQGASRHFMRTKSRIDANEVLRSVDAKKYPYHFQLVSDYINGYFTASERDGQFLRKIIYASNLTWSASFTIQQLFQPLTMHVPRIVLEAGSLKAPLIMAKAYAMTAGYMGLRAVGRVSGARVTQQVSQELQQFIDRAMRRESIAGSMIEELAANASRHGGHLYAPRLTGLLVKAGADKETVQSGLRTMESVMEFAGSITEKYNRVLGFIEGYLIGKDRGLSGESLYKFSEIWTGEVNIEYGKHNLPIFINQSGRAKPIARSFYTFMSYQFAAMHQAALLFRSDQPLTRRIPAVMSMVLSYTVAAGLLGNIFGQLIGHLWQSIFGGDTPDKIITQNEDIPEWLRLIVDGGIMALLGVDMRRSLGVGDINPLDVSKTVPLQVVSRIGQAWEELKRGNYTRALTKAPVGVIPPLRGVARRQEAERYGYQYGRKAIVAPQDLSARELLTLSANLTPYRLGKAADVERIMYEEQATRREKYDMAVERVMRGVMVNDQTMIDEGIKQWQDYNQELVEKGQGYLAIDPDSFMGSVQRRLIEANAPDVRGSAKTRIEREEVRKQVGTTPRE